MFVPSFLKLVQKFRKLSKPSFSLFFFLALNKSKMRAARKKKSIENSFLNLGWNKANKILPIFNKLLSNVRLSTRLPKGFDSQQYLSLNKDVLSAINVGLCDSAENHYINFGRYEGRPYKAHTDYKGSLHKLFLGNPANAADVAIAEQRWEDALSLMNTHQTETAEDMRISALLSDEVVRRFGFTASQERYRRPELCLHVMQQMTERFPDEPHWWGLHIESLCILGRTNEAETILSIQRTRFPSYKNFTYNIGVIETQRENWKSASEHFREYLVRDPKNAVVKERLARAEMELAAASTQSPGAGLPETRRQDVGLQHDDEIRSLLLGFESLGCDCEFGLVQRRYGAEPLGLFRWNSTLLHGLVECLSADLVGLGEPENTVISTWGDSEYFVADKRWGFRFHTFTSCHEVEVDKFYPKMCKRIAYLREKFISDLKDSEKIFVFKSKDFSIENYKLLHGCLNKHRLNQMIIVIDKSTIETDQECIIECPSLYHLDNGLSLGVITEFGDKAGQWNVPFEEWVEICRAFRRSDISKFNISIKS